MGAIFSRPICFIAVGGRRPAPQSMKQETDEPLRGLLSGKTKVLPAPHVSFHQEISKEIKISRGQNERRIFPTPAGLLLDSLQSRSDQFAKALGHILKDFLEMLIL